jgi:hypothetical protein
MCYDYFRDGWLYIYFFAANPIEYVCAELKRALIDKGEKT